jgi:hypothetical protein
MAHDAAADILARFPGPVALVPSRLKWVLILLGCAGFVAIAVLLMPKNEAMTWLAIAFFGIGIAVALVMLMPGAGGMILDREGFTIVNLFRRNVILWTDATDFVADTIPMTVKKTVLFNLASAKSKMLGRLNVGLTGRNGAIPDTYGLSADDLANLMAQWRERALR